MPKGKLSINMTKGKKGIRSPKKVKRRLKPIYRNFFLSCVVLLLAVFSRFAYEQWTLQQQQKAFEQAGQTAFIEIVGETAEDLAARHDLYASVMVAQAILESDWGRSKLTKEANNLFGIKGDYYGQSYQIETAEDDGMGNLYMVMADFRKYPTYHASLQDHADLLSKGLIGAPDFYAGAWKSRTETYKDATAYLQGRYATDTQYAAKLNSLIEQYDLTRFD